MYTYVGKSSFGLGVFASRDIEAGEIIERCPVLVYDNTQSLSPDDHSYEWENGTWCINLGHGSLYNHGLRPNALYVRDYANKTMLYVSLCSIAAHEEILVNYNGNIYCSDPMWFEHDRLPVNESEMSREITSKMTAPHTFPAPFASVLRSPSDAEGEAGKDELHLTPLLRFGEGVGG